MERRVVEVQKGSCEDASEWQVVEWAELLLLLLLALLLALCCFVSVSVVVVAAVAVVD